MLLFILAFGILAAWLVSGHGPVLVAAAVVATVMAGTTAPALVRAFRATGYKPQLDDIPAVPLALHSAGIILLLGLAIAGMFMK